MKASQLYNLQNRIIHKIMAAAGMPYGQYRADWMEAICEAGGRSATGLSDLNLSQRRKLISRIGGKGRRLYNPGVPLALAGWRKGDPDIDAPAERRHGRFAGRPADRFFNDPDKGKMLSKIEAMLADARRPWKYAHRIAEQMHGVNRLEWCNEKQIHDIVSALVYDQRRHGRGWG